jgi:hypothetical protein
MVIPGGLLIFALFISVPVATDSIQQFEHVVGIAPNGSINNIRYASQQTSSNYGLSAIEIGTGFSWILRIFT